MDQLEFALKKLTFKWLPKHLNHIAEKIVIDKRNISFLAINRLFRIKNKKIAKSPEPFRNTYVVQGFVDTQKNDLLRTKEEELTVIFRIDKENNIIVITAYSESDEK